MAAEKPTTFSTATPNWISVILSWPPTWFLARLALASAYLLGGVVKLFDFPGAVAEQAHFGLQPAALWAVVAIIVEIAGALLLILGRFVWLAAGMLGALTAVATLVANNFWALQGHERFMATNSFFEHLGLIAGLAMAAMIADRRASRDAT